MSSVDLKLRFAYHNGVSALGPGKADLLDAISEKGSISAAAKKMGMSYKRAWDLVSTMNNRFKQPLVVTATGGSHGGGAEVTEFGRDVLKRYRDIHQKAMAAVQQETDDFCQLLR